MNNSKITLYALSTCPSCRKTSRFLEEKNIDFEKIEVDLLPSGEQWLMTKEVKKYNPEATYPTLVVSRVIVGFDERAMEETLGI